MTNTNILIVSLLCGVVILVLFLLLTKTSYGGLFEHFKGKKKSKAKSLGKSTKQKGSKGGSKQKLKALYKSKILGKCCPCPGSLKKTNNTEKKKHKKNNVR